MAYVELSTRIQAGYTANGINAAYTNAVFTSGQSTSTMRYQTMLIVPAAGNVILPDMPHQWTFVDHVFMVHLGAAVPGGVGAELIVGLQSGVNILGFSLHPPQEGYLTGGQLSLGRSSTDAGSVSGDSWSIHDSGIVNPSETSAQIIETIYVGH